MSYMNILLLGLKMNGDDLCLTDYATTHIILQNKRYFLELTLIKTNVSTIWKASKEQT